MLRRCERLLHRQIARQCRRSNSTTAIGSATLLQRAVRLEAEYDTLRAQAASDTGFDATTAARQKRLAELDPIVAAYHAHTDVTRQLAETQALLHDATETDDDLKSLAREELRELELQAESCTGVLRDALLPRHPRGQDPALLEIRSGVGGDEANLFAMDLVKMYERFAGSQGWPFKMYSMSTTEAGDGVTEAVASIGRHGQGVFEKLRFEAGVHRVQRTPATETKGRVHTSTASVHVLPELSEAELDSQEDDLVKVDESEVKLEVMRSRGAGGQHVNRTESAVRLTHIPTGISISMQDSRSQHANKRQAWLVLHTKLSELRRAELHAERVGERRSQVASLDRSEKCRTYNYAQSRVTDHRANYSSHNLEGVMHGDDSLRDLIDTVHAHIVAEEMQALSDQNL